MVPCREEQRAREEAERAARKDKEAEGDKFLLVRAAAHIHAHMSITVLGSRNYGSMHWISGMPAIMALHTKTILRRDCASMILI